MSKTKEGQARGKYTLEFKPETAQQQDRRFA